MAEIDKKKSLKQSQLDLERSKADEQILIMQERADQEKEKEFKRK